MARKVRKGLKVYKDHKVSKAQQVQQVTPAHKVRQVRKAFRVCKVRKASPLTPPCLITCKLRFLPRLRHGLVRMLLQRPELMR